MRNKFADICLDVVKDDDKSVIMIGDISHFALRISL